MIVEALRIIGNGAIILIALLVIAMVACGGSFSIKINSPFRKKAENDSDNNIK